MSREGDFVEIPALQQLRGSDWGLVLVDLVGGDLEKAELMQAGIRPVNST